MKVLHVHRIGGIGGSERHLLTLLPALTERGVDVRFLGLDDPSRAPDPFYEALAVPYERLAAPRDVDPALALRVRRAGATRPCRYSRCRDASFARAIRRPAGCSRAGCRG